jgi:hypothetical protein
MPTVQHCKTIYIKFRHKESEINEILDNNGCKIKKKGGDTRIMKVILSLQIVQPMVLL